MWPADLKNIYDRLKNLNVEFGFPENARPFIYQEVMDLGGEIISKTEYSGMGYVTEFMISHEMGLTFQGKKPLHDLLNWDPAKRIGRFRRHSGQSEGERRGSLLQKQATIHHGECFYAGAHVRFASHHELVRV